MATRGTAPSLLLPAAARRVEVTVAPAVRVDPAVPEDRAARVDPAAAPGRRNRFLE
ncbi:MAG: hypothetical protein ACJ787_09585 [Myxococcales bacterium]